MRVISQKKQALIDAYLAKPLKVGDTVEVRGLGLQDKSSWGNCAEVAVIFQDDSISVQTGRSEIGPIAPIDYRKWVGRIGAEPMEKKFDSIRTVNFNLESVLFGLGFLKDGVPDAYFIQGIEVSAGSFTPFLYDGEGKKVYYQRDLVWSLEDKRTLLDSIYNQVDCGKILVRLRGIEELEQMALAGETELSFKDVVDGKQRLNAVIDFIAGKYTDSYGNHYGDLSNVEQKRFLNHQLFSYSEMPEGTPDIEVRNQFLKLNFAGVPQSKEHIEFVKNINI